MASKTTENSKKRNRKAASIQPIAVEPRKDVVLNNQPAAGNLEEEIRRRAYELYLDRGGVPGNPGEDWLVAEQQVRSRQMEQAG